MKKILLLGFIILNALSLSAQKHQIKKEKKQLYVTHKVIAKETLYSVARLYNLTPKEIAAANKLDANAGLKIGQQLKIPLNKGNFVQADQKNKKDLEPVYHTISKGDNLYKVSKSYNNVKEELLKKWNRLSKNVVKPGQDIVVGYVKLNHTAVAAEVPVQEIKKQDEPVTKVQEKPLPQKNTVETPVLIPVKENKTDNPVVAPVGNKSQEKPVEIVETVNLQGEEGFFASAFTVTAAGAQQKNLSGAAATFKSTSGWNDKKYYVLINDIPAETIVKISANGRSVYAKVLESLPSLKENNGLVCRISNAAASALGITEAKFNVEVFYSE